MPPAPPSLSHLQELAESAVGHLEGQDAQVAVVWELSRGSRGERERLTATFTAVVDGRAATAVTTHFEDARLGRAAKAAVVGARRQRATPAPPLPEPAPGRSHDGFDPVLLTWDPPELDGLSWEAAASRIAIASTRGVRAAEQRGHAVVELERGTRERRVVVARSAVSPTGLDTEALIAEAGALDPDGTPVPPPDVPAGLVLGAQAVAALLDHLRPAFGVHLDVGGGPLAGREGTRVAAPAVNLSDSARHPATLQRSYDAEGVPRRPVPLIQDGVAHRRVHDSASAQRSPGATSTGHATRAAALAPLPEHLVLAGGGTETIDELCAPLPDGLYVPALARGDDGHLWTRGAIRIAGGRFERPVADHPVRADPLRVLASVDALSAKQRLVALPGHTPGGAGAATVPALRCRAGLEPV